MTRPDQAALILAGSVLATPSVNLTPSMTRGNDPQVTGYPGMTDRMLSEQPTECVGMRTLVTRIWHQRAQSYGCVGKEVWKQALPVVQRETKADRCLDAVGLQKSKPDKVAKRLSCGDI